MKPAPFDYLRPESLEEALEALARHGEDARVIAGGQSLVPMLNMRLASAGVLVDVAGLPGMDGIAVADGAVEVGCAVRQAALEAWPGLGERAPLIKAMLPHIGHLQTRNRGTVCGSLCHGDPSSELPLALALLGGEVVLRSRRGERRVPARDFQTGMLSTARRPDEIAVAARFPTAEPETGYAFAEFARRHGDFAIVALACAVRGETVRLGVAGVADRPTVREWTGLSDETEIDDALNDFAWALGGGDDIHATARQRRELVRRLGRRIILEARECRS